MKPFQFTTNSCGTGYINGTVRGQRLLLATGTYIIRGFVAASVAGHGSARCTTSTTASSAGEQTTRPISQRRRGVTASWSALLGAQYVRLLLDALLQGVGHHQALVASSRFQGRRHRDIHACQENETLANRMEMGISRGLKHPCRVLLKLILDTRYLKQTI